MPLPENDVFKYREIPVLLLHFLGWQFVFEYNNYYYYAFFENKEYAKEGAKSQIDNLLNKEETEYDERRRSIHWTNNERS